MSRKEKLKPFIDEKITKLINMKVLQRVDPCVQEIITTSGHVAIYELNTDKAEWKRKNVEGSLFVVERSSEPRFQFIVMNRLHAENLVESLAGDFEWEVYSPYLLYRNQREETNGIWFYHGNESEEIGNLFRRILNKYSKVPAKSKVSPMKREVEKDAFPKPSFTTTSKAADVVERQCFVNISSSSTALAPVPLKSTDLDIILSASVPASSPSSASIMPIPTEQRSTNLVKPTSFPCPRPSPSILPLATSPSVPTCTALISPGNLKQPYGTLLLQPFPPPSPQPRTPTSVTTPTHGPIMNREKVEKALRLLFQDNQFIDIVYRAALNALGY